MIAIAEIFFQMFVGHALADFVLQSDAMGAGKNRNNKMQERKGLLFPPWYYWMSAHALIHGGIIYLITGSLVLGVIETVLHFIVDFCKCEGWINIHQDQALHIICKLGYCWWLFV